MTPHIDDHIPALRRYAYRLTKNTDTAEDLVQDTLTRMLSKGPISSIDNIESYMRSVMHNLFVDGTRKHKSDAVPIDLVEPVDEAASQNLRLTCQETMAAINRLPEDYADVLVRHACKGQSYAQIADALDIPQGTVMSRISRARAALCASLDIGGGLDLLESA